MRTIRSATLVGYEYAARSVGLNPDVMLARVGLDKRCLSDYETPISLDAYFQLLEDSAESSHCADFGMRASLARGVPDYGIVSLLMREAETVEEAINYYTTHISLHADGICITLNQRYRHVELHIDIDARTADQTLQVAQFAVIGITTQIQFLLGEAFCPAEVFLPATPTTITTDFNTLLRCPLSLTQPVPRVVLPSHVLQRRLNTSTPLLRKIAQRHLRPALPTPKHTFSAKVDRLIRDQLDDGTCDAAAIANYLHIDRRTLTRRLALENETFSSLLQRIRIDIAERALTATEFSLSSIADETGFSSLSAFSRWFAQTFGVTATVWRKQATLRLKEKGTSRPNWTSDKSQFVK